MPADFNNEAAVDAMLVEGRRIVDEAIEQYKPVAIVAAYSGGNDSGPSSHFGAHNYDAPALHCATGTGCPETLCHVRRFCEKNHMQLIEKTAPIQGPPQPRKGRPFTFDEKALPAGKWMDGDTAYEESVLNWGFPGPAQHGLMYRRLKERSVRGFVKKAKQGHDRMATVMIISGIRHDESKIRAGYQRAVSKVQSQIWVNPFYYATAAHFEAYRQEFGLARNPVKDKVGISGECNCGAFAGENEIERIEAASPSTAAYLRQLQDRVQANGHTWSRWGKPPTRDYLDSKSGQMMMDFNDDAGDWQPMCVGCGKERKIA